MNKIQRQAKEEIDDLKFQLEEKTIELEGTRAQLRVLESKISFSPEHLRSPLGCSSDILRDSTMRLQQSVSTPSMKAMIPLAMDEVLQNSSSTESAQDQAERDKAFPETPKRRPSKIPLPGTKANVAPKPPTGRSGSSGYGMTRSTSGPSSNRSLNKSTSSLLDKTDSSFIKKECPSLNRPESAQSWRKDSSLNNRSSSIPVSAKTSPAKPSFSPIPKPKRDSLTSKVRNLDSLSRIQTSSTTTPTTSSPISSSNLYKSTSKKDLSSSFTNGAGNNSRSNLSNNNSSNDNNRKMSSVNASRRVSSVSVGSSSSGGRNNGISSNNSDLHQHQHNEDNSKVRNTRSTFWNWWNK